MARTPTTASNVALVRTLGAGWHFPIVYDRATKGYAKLLMAADELSVRQSIEIILSTSKGERVMRPDFGCDLNKLLFAPNNGTTQALAEFEVSEALARSFPHPRELLFQAFILGINSLCW